MLGRGYRKQWGPFKIYRRPLSAEQVRDEQQCGRQSGNDLFQLLDNVGIGDGNALIQVLSLTDGRTLGRLEGTCQLFRASTKHLRNGNSISEEVARLLLDLESPVCRDGAWQVSRRPGEAWKQALDVLDRLPVRQQVAAGRDHTLVVTGGADLYSFGWGARGQLGLGVPDRPFHTMSADTAADAEAMLAAAAIEHAMPQGGDTDGLVLSARMGRYEKHEPVLLCCGGWSDDPDALVPNFPRNTHRIAVGANSSAAITTNGDLWVWGSCGCVLLLLLCFMCANQGVTSA